MSTRNRSIEANFDEWSRRVLSTIDRERWFAAVNFRVIVEYRSRKALPLFLPLLRDGNLTVRRQAVSSAMAFTSTPVRGRARASVNAALRDALRDDDTLVRVRAARVLLALRVGSTDALAVLEPLAADADEEVRAEAVEALGHTDEPDDDVVAIIERALEDENERVRAFAAHTAAGWWGRCEGAVPILLRGLDDPDPLVRASFASALHKVTWQKPLDLATVADLLGRSDPAIRRAAAGLLQTHHRRSRQAVQLLTDALADHDRGVRSAAAVGLGNRGWRAVRALSRLWRAFRSERRPFERWWLFLSMERVLVPVIPPLTSATVVVLLVVRVLYALTPAVLRPHWRFRF